MIFWFPWKIKRNQNLKNIYIYIYILYIYIYHTHKSWKRFFPSHRLIPNFHRRSLRHHFRYISTTLPSRINFGTRFSPVNPRAIATSSSQFSPGTITDSCLQWWFDEETVEVRVYGGGSTRETWEVRVYGGGLRSDGSSRQMRWRIEHNRWIDGSKQQQNRWIDWIDWRWRVRRGAREEFLCA